MAARDRYSRKLECARCRNEGYAEVSEADRNTQNDPDFKVDSLPVGFVTERASRDPAKHTIRCRCGHVFAFKQKSHYPPGGEPRF